MAALTTVNVKAAVIKLAAAAGVGAATFMGLLYTFQHRLICTVPRRS